MRQKVKASVIFGVHRDLFAATSIFKKLKSRSKDVRDMGAASTQAE